MKLKPIPSVSKMVVELFQALRVPVKKIKSHLFFFKKGAESPQQLGLWFDSYYKGRASVFENEMKTASHNPFFLFHQGAGAPEHFNVLMHLHQNIENVFVNFYLTYLLRTKPKEGKCHN